MKFKNFFTKTICCIIGICVFSSPLNAFAETTNETLSVNTFEKEYNVEITPVQDDNLTQKEAKQLETYLKNAQLELANNNQEEEDYYQERVLNGIAKNNIAPSVSSFNTLASKPNTVHTSVSFTSIGSAYPGLTIIKGTLVANRVYSQEKKRYLYGTVISNKSSKYSGKGDSWKQTDAKANKIDGGRTYYVSVWGDLKETVYVGLNKYVVESKGWRVHYEATCPQ